MLISTYATDPTPTIFSISPPRPTVRVIHARYSCISYSRAVERCNLPTIIPLVSKNTRAVFYPHGPFVRRPSKLYEFR